MTGSYRESGVDIEAGDEAVLRIAALAATTRRPEVLGDIGGFAGAFAFDPVRYADPVLFSATDGVGTKLAIAQTLGIHDTVGIDLVAMVVDDLVCHGAESLFLLDYISCGRLLPERVSSIVAGIAAGCRIAGCALLGGETAEHPGIVDPDEYDLAAFAVGACSRAAVLGPKRVVAGDVVVGLASSGLHSNGYSLVRRIILEHDLTLDEIYEPLPRSLGEELLEPTRIHAPAVLAAVQAAEVHAAAHITGGGIAGNLVRVLPDGLAAIIDPAAWTVPPIFEFLRKTGQILPEEMAKVFNLGVGMTIVVERAKAGDALEALASRGEKAFVMGEIVAGARGVRTG